jgi:hypothetical protein
VASSISPPRVSSLFHISGEGGGSDVFSDGLGRRMGGGISDTRSSSSQTMVAEFFILSLLCDGDGQWAFNIFDSFGVCRMMAYAAYPRFGIVSQWERWISLKFGQRRRWSGVMLKFCS